MDFNVSDKHVVVYIEGDETIHLVREDRPVLIWGGDPPPTCELLNSFVKDAFTVVSFAGRSLPKIPLWIMSKDFVWHKVTKVSWLGVVS